MIKNTVSKIIFILMIIYLANLTFGMDLIPDNTPLFGNIDEVVATYIALRSAGATE